MLTFWYYLFKYMFNDSRGNRETSNVKGLVFASISTLSTLSTILTC